MVGDATGTEWKQPGRNRTQRRLSIRLSVSSVHQTGQQISLFVTNQVDPVPSWHSVNGLDQAVLTRDRKTPRAWLRAGYLATTGLPATRVAFLYPSESLWIQTDPRDGKWMMDQLAHWHEQLMDWGYEGDLVDPLTLMGQGKVDRQTGLRIGSANYRVLIVPPCLTQSTGVLERLAAFVSDGGRLIFLEPSPYLADGKVHQRMTLLESLLARHTVSVLREDALPAKLLQLLSELPVTLNLYERSGNDPANGIWRRERYLDHMRWYFLWNSRSDPCDLLAEMVGEKQCECWDLRTGARMPLPSWYANGYTYTEFVLAVNEQKVLFTW